ncbi:MAG: SUMF1/EgtB/PvdO family nonheme iron enzyme [Anaerolineae bacterium]|nr:SUMF1/EgtB/PvdO family nonheme iron enzyme [Anaerolineae bacterium]
MVINSVNTNIQNMNRAATQVANSQMSASQQAAAKLTSVAYATNEMATSRAFIIALTQTPAAAALSARQTAAYNATQIAQSVALTQTLDTSKIAPTLTALPSPIAAGSTNTAWKPIEYEFNGVPMVLVPAGCFNMGSNNGNKDERPPTPICFSSPFWIDTIEVTQGQFKYFGGSKAKATARNVSTYPIAEVTWFEARDFCAIRGMRLPTEAEWEYAARGPQALRYPWGNTNTAASTMSWVGAANMAGVTEDNVSEWTSSEYKPYPYNESDGRENPDDRGVKRVVRGGFWGFTDDWRSAVRVALLPNETFQYTGFRCASIARGKPIVSTAAPTAGTTTSTTSTAPTTIPAQASRTVVATLASSATMPSQSSSSTGTINDLNNVNVREKPDFAARIRTSVKPGTKVTILGMNDDKLWYHIQLDDGTEGWVWASYINLSTTAGATTVSPTTVSTQSSTGVINDLNNVNVRENPDSTARIRTSVKPGTKVTILGMNDDKSWYHIQLDDGTEGWVRATFVNLSN